MSIPNRYQKAFVELSRLPNLAVAYSPHNIYVQFHGSDRCLSDQPESREATWFFIISSFSITCLDHCLDHGVQGTGLSSASDLASSVNQISIDYDTWHNRFGHPGKNVLLNAPKNVKGLPKLSIPTENFPCKGCVLGKAATKAYPRSSKRAADPLDLVHADLVELPILSYHKFKYVITLLDDCSSYAVSIMLWKKSEAFQAFKDYKSWAEKQTDRQLNRIFLPLLRLLQL